VRFLETKLPGAYLVELEPREDERGSFARTWCRDELAEHGLSTAVSQCSVSHNTRAGTLRGLHFQAVPHEEVKLVRCTHGAIFDVIVDLRPRSETEGEWIGVELTATAGNALYVPKGFAHGFQTLADDCELIYLHSRPYAADAEGALNARDPALAIAWPLPITDISERDAKHPCLTSEFTGI